VPDRAKECRVDHSKANDGNYAQDPSRIEVQLVGDVLVEQIHQFLEVMMKDIATQRGVAPP